MPVLVVMLVQPAALGSYAVSSRSAVPGGGDGQFPPLAAPAEGTGGYRLTRFVSFCCAADAEALQAVVRGDPTPRARDQWLEVEGTWLGRPASVDDPTPPPPVLQADVVRPVAPARPPYEYSVQFGG